MAADKSAPEVAAAVMQGVRDAIRVYEDGLVRMRKAEVDALKKSMAGAVEKKPGGRSVFNLMKSCCPKCKASPCRCTQKSEDFIDTREDADPEKRFHHVGANDNKQMPKKEVKAPGSGGAITKGKKLKKDGMDPTKPGAKALPKIPMIKPRATVKPAGVPGAKMGQAPKAAKVPSAPGMTGAVQKSEDLEKAGKSAPAPAPAPAPDAFAQALQARGKPKDFQAPPQVLPNGMQIHFNSLGQIHNEHGPAIIHPNGRQEFYLEGRPVNAPQRPGATVDGAGAYNSRGVPEQGDVSRADAAYQQRLANAPQLPMTERGSLGEFLDPKLRGEREQMAAYNVKNPQDVSRSPSDWKDKFLPNGRDKAWKSERNVFDILSKSHGADAAAKIIASAQQSLLKAEPCPYCKKSLFGDCQC